MKIFELDIKPLDMKAAVACIVNHALKRDKGLIVTPNVDHIITLKKDREFKRIYKESLMILADGMPIVWLSKLLPGKSLPERVPGSDLLYTVCGEAAKKDLVVSFVGGSEGSADQAAENLRMMYDGLCINGVYCPPFGFENDKDESLRLVEFLNAKKPDILFFGVGAPKQEKWADQYKDMIDVGPILCVGAAFDFASGKVSRAPRFIQNIGFEWMWRLISEPGRLWKRYLIRDSKFIWYGISEIASSWSFRIMNGIEKS